MSKRERVTRVNPNPDAIKPRDELPLVAAESEPVTVEVAKAYDMGNGVIVRDDTREFNENAFAVGEDQDYRRVLIRENRRIDRVQFSTKIAKELRDAVDEHCARTGEMKIDFTERAFRWALENTYI